MRTPKVIVGFFIVLAAVAASLVLAGLFVTFSSHHDTRIKEASLIYIPAITLAPSATWEQRIRDAVLEQLPIGSARPQIQAFLRRHFVRVEYRIARSDEGRALIHFSEPHIFIRAIDDSGFAGGCRVEIYLLLTPEEHLRDVVVRAIEGYV